MRRSEILKRRKSQLVEFFDNASIDEKIEIINKWYNSDKAIKKFNKALLDAVNKKHKGLGLSKGDIAYVNSIFTAFKINPLHYRQNKEEHAEL